MAVASIPPNQETTNLKCQHYLPNKDVGCWHFKEAEQGLGLEERFHGSDQGFDGIDALLERGLFGIGQRELDDFFHATGSEDDGNADIVAADAVFIAAQRRAWDQSLRPLPPFARWLQRERSMLIRF
jgi:hypothetical protein